MNGPQPPVDPAKTGRADTRPVNLAELVGRAAATAPEHPAIVSAGRRLTWSELDREVSVVAAGLAGAGLVAGLRVALVMPNSTEFVAAYFGALRAGLVAVPINPESPAAEIGPMLRAVRARLVVTDPTCVDEVRRAVANVGDPHLEVVPVGSPAQAGERAYDDLLASAPAPAVPPRDPESLAVLLFTSGTSSSPRAAMLTHRALLANLDQMAAIDPAPIRADDVVLGILPFFHVFGLNAVLGMAARAAATVVLTGRFDPDGTLDQIGAEHVSNIPAAPPVFATWAGRADLADKLKGVRLLVSGAAPLPPGVRARIRTATGLTVHEGYGLTEAAPTVSSTLSSAAAAGEVKDGSVGGPLPGVGLRVVDERGVEVERGEPGEVIVRGPNLFSGYWPDGAGAPGPNGWFATGDLGYLDDDGDLVLVDRLKELVIVSGFNVYPREVETVIADLPGVVEVAVIAVPDPQTGEAVKAYVVPAPGAELTPDVVKEHCRVRLARFKCPTAVEVVDALPRSVTGKIAKVRLRSRS